MIMEIKHSKSQKIELLKEEINGKGYEMPHPNVHQITEINLDDYK